VGLGVRGWGVGKVQASSFTLRMIGSRGVGDDGPGRHGGLPVRLTADVWSSEEPLSAEALRSARRSQEPEVRDHRWLMADD